MREKSAKHTQIADTQNNFSIVSWIATAEGLHEYVFTNYYWQAMLISFGIQSILFVFNLKLPEYFRLIGLHSKNPNSNLIKRFFFRILLAIFYILFLFSSSCFSFVYIANRVYENTQYIDANVTLDNTYRTYLDNTDKYIQQLSYDMLISISEQTAELQNMVPNNDETSFKSESELQETVAIAQMEYDNAESMVTIAQNFFDAAKMTYETPMTVRWRSQEDLDKEAASYWTANTNLQTALEEKNTAWLNLEQAKQELNEYEEPLNTTVLDLLTDVLSPNPSASTLKADMDKFYSMILEIDENSLAAGEFADIVIKTQDLNNVITNYSILQGIQTAEDDNIKSLKIALIDDQIIVPDPKAEDFDEQKKEWEGAWRKRFSILEKNIKNILVVPAAEGKEMNSAYNNQLYKTFDAQQISEEIDKISRSNLANINALERAFNLLSSDFPFLAWFALGLALFIDLASLGAGLFVYLVSAPKLNKEQAETERYEYAGTL